MRCLCACTDESEEMVCCDGCGGWSHLKCIGMKEGVGVMEGKEFVCYFCVSAWLVTLRKEVGRLREELGSVKSELRDVREENGRLRSQIEQERPERLRVAQEEVVVNVTECEEVGNVDVAKAMKPGVEEKKTSQQKSVTGSGSEMSRVSFAVGKQKNNGQKERSNRWVSGVRKVWRTRHDQERRKQKRREYVE